MNTIIYYFSATGNSLKVASDIAEKLGNTKLLSMTAVEDCQSEAPFDRIGFVFPVYMWGIPAIVDKFIEHLHCINQNVYVFAIVTYKTSPGAVLNYLGKKLLQRGLHLSAGFTITMPGNNIIYYDAESHEAQQKKFQAWNNQIDDIVTMLQNRLSNHYHANSIIKKILLTSIGHKLITNTYHKADKNFWTNNNCSGCGICARVCPVMNITITDCKPVWLHKCEQCTACINLCPMQAIQFSRFTADKKRYINPCIKLNQLQRKY